MDKMICLTGGAVFDGETLRERGGVVFNEKGIFDIIDGERVPSGVTVIDVGGETIMPGMVDLHSDALEQSIEMRPGAHFDVGFALENLDRRIASTGITTYCHALSFADNELGLRSPGEVENMVRRIKAFDTASGAMVNHLVHARYEMGAVQGLMVLERLLDEGLIDMVSVMDHTPGQGQFKTLHAFVDYYTGSSRCSPEAIVEMASRKMGLRESGWERSAECAARVKEMGLPFLSHDDDTPEKVTLVKALGVQACEFPLSLDAARRAKAEGLQVFMGAPNLVRGKSTGGHLKAATAVAEGACDGLLSDYYPECMLQAPFTAAKGLGLPLEKALALVTSGPGRFLQPHLGALAVGGMADIVVCNHQGPWARASQIWVGGRCVQSKGPRQGNDREEARDDREHTAA